MLRELDILTTIVPGLLSGYSIFQPTTGAIIICVLTVKELKTETRNQNWNQYWSSTRASPTLVTQLNTSPLLLYQESI